MGTLISIVGQILTIVRQTLGGVSASQGLLTQVIGKINAESEANAKAFQALGDSVVGSFKQAENLSNDRFKILSDKLERVLEAIESKPAVGFKFVLIRSNGEILEGVNSMILKDSEKVTATIVAVDAKGNAASVDGAPAWTTSDASVVSVSPAADGMSAVVTAVGPLGTAQVTVTADADMGSGVTAISGRLDVEVQSGPAVSLQINVGTPEAQ